MPHRSQRPSRFDTHIERVAVFRPLALGGMLCTVPALRALRDGFPSAQITLVGWPWARSLAQRLDCIDAFVDFPGFPGVGEPAAGDVQALPDFLAQMQAQRFDLALQMQGTGEIANPLVASFAARHTAGFATAQGWRPPDDAGLFIPWPEHGHEVDRLLALTGHLGLPNAGTALDFPLVSADRDEARALLGPAAGPQPYVCVHVGAPRPSRRWDVRRFAEVADAIAARGRTIVLTGADSDAGLVHDMVACMHHEAIDLCGRTTLWTLGAIVEGAETVVCSDAGISHLAAALGRPSVVVGCGYDAERWTPPDMERHRVIAQPVPCRPCNHHSCPHDHECATQVGPVHVLRQWPQATAEALR